MKQEFGNIDYVVDMTQVGPVQKIGHLKVQMIYLPGQHFIQLQIIQPGKIILITIGKLLQVQLLIDILDGILLRQVG